MNVWIEDLIRIQDLKLPMMMLKYKFSKTNDKEIFVRICTETVSSRINAR